eukprot:3939841-Rhodomonas_salina.3
MRVVSCARTSMTPLTRTKMPWLAGTVGKNAIAKKTFSIHRMKSRNGLFIDRPGQMDRYELCKVNAGGSLDIAQRS